MTLAILLGGTLASAERPVDHRLIGRRPAAWPALEWLDGRPRTWADLRGRVVLVRFWTDTCPYCANSAPTLRRLDEELRDEGLAVIGVYHPKPRGRAVERAEIDAAVRRFGWRFPIALDPRWEALDAMWLRHHPRGATSASLLIDRRGVIRWIHPGPEYAIGSADAAALRRAVEALLAE